MYLYFKTLIIFIQFFLKELIYGTFNSTFQHFLTNVPSLRILPLFIKYSKFFFILRLNLSIKQA